MSPRGPQSVMNAMIGAALDEVWPGAFTRRGTVFAAERDEGVAWLLEGEPETHAQQKGTLEFTLAWGVDVEGWDEILLAEVESPPRGRHAWNAPVSGRVYDVTELPATRCWWKASVEPAPPKGLLGRLLGGKPAPLAEAVVALRGFFERRAASPAALESFLAEVGSESRIRPLPPGERLETLAALQIVRGRRAEAEASIAQLRRMATANGSARISHRADVLAGFLA